MRYWLLGLLGGISMAAAPAAEPVVSFLFDQNLDALLRIEDLNADGDTLDAGEVVTVYNDVPPLTGIENSQGVIVLGPGEVLATDNFAPQNVVHLVDLNGDGDAFDAGEAAVWFDGMLPNGYALNMPVALTLGTDGAVYLFDAPFSGTAVPDAIYRLADSNGDGDASDAGEAVLWVELSPAGVAEVNASDLEFDESGCAYFVNHQPPQPPVALRIDPAGNVSEYLTDAAMLALTGVHLCSDYGGALAYDAVRERLIVAGIQGIGVDYLVELVDENESGAIDAAGEAAVVWDGAGPHTPVIGEFRDLAAVPDGTLVFADQLLDACWRLCDANGDGDYHDAGETLPVYSAAAAQAAGQPFADRPLTISAWLAAQPGDSNCDGELGFGDINYFVAALSGGETAWEALFSTPPTCAFVTRNDCNRDGQVSLADINPFVAALSR